MAPAGAPASRLNVSVLSGRSVSLAVAANVNSTPSSTAWSPIGSSTGARFTSLTAIVIVSKSSKAGVPLSVTRTVTLNVPGPSASVGVQLKTPVCGSIVAPAGAPASRVNVSVSSGRSGSLAAAVNVSSVPSSTAWFPIGSSTGAEVEVTISSTPLASW